jgi:zinc transporter, ZIP family
MFWVTAWAFEHSAGSSAVPPPALFVALGSLSALSLVATLAGGYLVSRGGRSSGALQALAAGLLLSIVIVEILPGLELRGTSMWTIEGFACLGLFAYAAVSWAGPGSHPGAHRHARRIVGWSGAAGFLLHRFFEAAAAATGLLLDPRLAAGILAVVVVHWAAEGAAVATYLSSLDARGPSVAAALTVLAGATFAGALTASAMTLPAAADRAVLAAFCGVVVFAAQLTASRAAAVLGSARAYALAASGAMIFSLAELAG